MEKFNEYGVEINIYKKYVTTMPMDINEVVEAAEKIAIKEGSLAIEEFGLWVLHGTYYDFWKWIYEEQEIQGDEILTEVACYTQNGEIMKNKQKLLEVIKTCDPYTASELKLPVVFRTEKPPVSYCQRRRVIARDIEIARSRYYKELQKYNHSLTKFSIETESAQLWKKSSKSERQHYLREINTYDLTRAFILYCPSQRDLILECMSLRLRNLLLEDMKSYVEHKDFSLDECVQSECKITDIIKKINQLEKQISEE